MHVQQLSCAHLNNVSASLCDVVQNGDFVLCIFIVMKIFYDSIFISTKKKNPENKAFLDHLYKRMVTQTGLLLRNSGGVGLVSRPVRNPGQS